MKERRYTRAYVEKILRERDEAITQRLHMEHMREVDRIEARRLEQLVDERWNEMQRLRDLIFAIATKSSPRNVVEREIERLGGATAMTIKEKMEKTS